MKGSEKQIAWAEDIKISSREAIENYIEERLELAGHIAGYKTREEVLTDLEDLWLNPLAELAQWWIQYRADSPRDWILRAKAYRNGDHTPRLIAGEKTEAQEMRNQAAKILEEVK